MKNKDQIMREVDSTLQSLDGLKRAEANPFLFTRIKARMERQSGIWEQISSFVTRPVVALAILFLVMAVNGWVVFSSGSPEAVSEPETIAISGIAEEYNLTFATIYDYENPVSNTTEK